MTSRIFASLLLAFLVSLRVSAVLAAPIEIPISCDPAGGTCASSSTVAGSYDASWSFLTKPDPSITGSFTRTNLSSSTQTLVITVTLGIAPVGPTLAITGSVATPGSLTDATGDGAVLQTDAANDPMCSAGIDGVSVHSEKTMRRNRGITRCFVDL